MMNQQPPPIPPQPTAAAAFNPFATPGPPQPGVPPQIPPHPAQQPGMGMGMGMGGVIQQQPQAATKSGGFAAFTSNLPSFSSNLFSSGGGASSGFSIPTGGNVFGGQSLSDRVNAARYALAGQGLARAVCKATTEELIAPKKKHLDYLLQCTHEPSVSIPNMANLLLERALAPTSSWVVVFKCMTTLHHLMCYGNDRFSAYLASAPDIGLKQLSAAYVDRTNTPLGSEMAPFVRRYASYVLARIASYRTAGFDFAKVKRSATPAQQPIHPQASTVTNRTPANQSVVLRDLPLEKIMGLVPTLQTQVDALVNFEAKEQDLRNGVIRAAFLLLFRDLVRLFASFNDCIISLLEKFFKISDPKEARSALKLYIDFTERMERVALFLKTAESIGVEKGEIPDLFRAPASLLNALEAHCYVLEGKDPTEVLNRPPPQPKVAQPPPPPVPPQPVAAFGAAPPIPPAPSMVGAGYGGYGGHQQPPVVPPPPAAAPAFNPFAAAAPPQPPPPVPPAPVVASPPQPPPTFGIGSINTPFGTISSSTTSGNEEQSNNNPFPTTTTSQETTAKATEEETGGGFNPFM